MELKLLNGWPPWGGQHAKPRARKFKGTVYLEGLVGHQKPVRSMIATLPRGFRPRSGRRMFSGNQDAAAFSARVDVYSSGDIELVCKAGNMNYVPLDNVVYRV